MKAEHNLKTRWDFQGPYVLIDGVRIDADEFEFLDKYKDIRNGYNEREEKIKSMKLQIEALRCQDLSYVDPDHRKEYINGSIRAIDEIHRSLKKLQGDM